MRAEQGRWKNSRHCSFMENRLHESERRQIRGLPMIHVCPSKPDLRPCESSPNSAVIRTAADGGSGTGVKMQWLLTQNAFRLHGIAARQSCLSDAGAWSPFRLSCKRHCAD